MTTPAKSRLSTVDLISESVAGMLTRPGRTALTILGTVLGVAALVATLGLANTAGNQIVGRFDALSATSVSVENQRSGFSFGGNLETSAIPWNAEARLTRLNGVVAAGTLSRVDVDDLVHSVPINDPLGQSDYSIDLYASSPGLFRAIKGAMRTGRYFDRAHSDLGLPVAVLGPGAAARLNVNRVDQQPLIFIGETPLTVIGIIDDVQRETGLLQSIIVPEGFARRELGLLVPSEVQIDVELGAAGIIGEQAAAALSPDNPGELRISVPPEPRGVQASVQTDVDALFLLLGAVALLVGGIGIANVTLVSVLERVGEIGVRRAVGARKHHIAAQFLIESAAMGVVGGIIGASIGVLVVVGVSAAREWTPVLRPWIPLLAPLLGGFIGLIAGLYPAWRAASLEPVEALRRGA